MPLFTRVSSILRHGYSKNKIYASGGSVVVGGDRTFHVFISPGTFEVTYPSEFIGGVECLIVAGGGGSVVGGGGGGGGGMRVITSQVSENSSYPISVGSGGIANPSPTLRGGTGGPSSAFGFTSAGGGGGGRHGIWNGTIDNIRPGYPGGPGGSGGGGGGAYAFAVPSFNTASGGTGGPGNTPPVSPPQGSSGSPGDGATGSSTPYSDSGGGGGAGGSGSSQNGGSGRLLPPNFPVADIGPLFGSTWQTVVGTYGLSRGGNGTNPLGVIPTTVPNVSAPTMDNTGYGGHAQPQAFYGASGLVIVSYSNTAGITTL
jgi:hypothetical protein